MILESPTLIPGAALDLRHVFNDWGYPGQNRSPALSWRDAPAETQSFALSCYDPDAPTGSGFWHWYVINLPADTCALPEGAGDLLNPQLPTGARQMRNDLGQCAFVGAFPPKGDPAHRYQFTLFALRVPRLELPEDASTAFAGFNVRANTIASVELAAFYQA